MSLKLQPNMTQSACDLKICENNVTSTTVPKKPHQASANRNDVHIDMNGNKAVEITLKDGTVKMIPYDSRGLAVFDDVVVFTTKIDTTKSYIGQMKQASLDMWEAIKNDPVAQSKFTSSQLDSLKRGKAKIEGLTPAVKSVHSNLGDSNYAA